MAFISFCKKEEGKGGELTMKERGEKSMKKKSKKSVKISKTKTK